MSVGKMPKSRRKGGVSLVAVLTALMGMMSANGGIDREFFDGLLRIPSRCGDEPQLVRVVDYTRAWLTAHGVWCVVETNEVGRVALYAGTVPGKVHDYQFVSHAPRANTLSPS